MKHMPPTQDDHPISHNQSETRLFVLSGGVLLLIVFMSLAFDPDSQIV